MHRFYLPPENCRNNLLRLDGREAHHALHVLRLKRGERVAVLDGAGHEFLCDVQDATKNSVALEVKEKKLSPPPASAITLLVAIPKGKIIESIIQKAVELGAHRVVPLLTERVTTQLDDENAEHKREKWQNVAIEAIKQCGAAWLPEIESPVTIEQFLARSGVSAERRIPQESSGFLPKAAAPFDLSLVGSLQTERRHPREWVLEFQKQHGHLPQTAAVWIGPEGDFTLDELKMIRAAGAKPITLGQLTLRVETAAIYCLSILNYELNR
ncbi:MAG TPA: RsmE family RNA methyltransferase [Verrucomicrobiae bacterium]